MKFLLMVLLSFTLLLGAQEKLIIDAKNFETNDSKGLTIFTGDVKLKMSKDKLNSQRLEIYMKPKSKGKAKEPLKYIATGNASFEIHTNGKIYKGKGGKIIYNPKSQEYTVLGDGHIKEEIEGKELFGDKIFINQVTGNAKVSGSSKKPVRFIINVDNGAKK